MNCILRPSNLPAGRTDSDAANSFRLSMGLRRIWEDNRSQSQFHGNASRRFGERKENAKINRTKKQFGRTLYRQPLARSSSRLRSSPSDAVTARRFTISRLCA